MGLPAFFSYPSSALVSPRSFESMPSEHCAELADPDVVQFGISLFICIGILVSYLPQHFNIFLKRSSAGISPYFVLLGTLSVNFALAYILALPTSRDDMACCRVNDGLSCFAGILGALQIATQFACFWLILVLWLAFFPHATAMAPPSSPAAAPQPSTAIVVAAVCAVHAVLLAVLNFVLTSYHPEVLQAYANVLGIAATLIAVVQFLPQIYTTYVLKSVGALSIPMMCIQTPGSYVWAASLAVRLGWAGWSIWGLYLVTGFLQGVILVLGVTYEVRERRKRKMAEREQRRGAEGAGEANGQAAAAAADERTPLVRNDAESGPGEQIHGE